MISDCTEEALSRRRESPATSRAPHHCTRRRRFRTLYCSRIHLRSCRSRIRRSRPTCSPRQPSCCTLCPGASALSNARSRRSRNPPRNPRHCRTWKDNRPPSRCTRTGRTPSPCCPVATWCRLHWPTPRVLRSTRRTRPRTRRCSSTRPRSCRSCIARQTCRAECWADPACRCRSECRNRTWRRSWSRSSRSWSRRWRRRTPAGRRRERLQGDDQPRRIRGRATRSSWRFRSM